MGIAIIIPDVFPTDKIGSVTLNNEKKIRSLTVVGDATVNDFTAKYNTRYTPITTMQRDVRWSITSGDEYATIGPTTGQLSVIYGADESPVTVKATSVNDAGVFATKTVNVSYPEEYNVTLLFHQCNKATSGTQFYNFDVIAEDNWMLLFYRTACTRTGRTTDDFYIKDGGFSVTMNLSGRTSIKGYTSESSSSSSKIFNNPPGSKVIAFKKENGVYSFTLNGTTWTSFSSYYAAGKSSTQVACVAGRTTNFIVDNYGLYVYSGVDESLVADFFQTYNS